VAGAVLDVDDVEATGVSLTAGDGADSTDVLAADDVADVTGVELDPVGDLAAADVELDGVADLAVWVRVADGSAVVCHQVWDVLLGVEDLLHSAELVAGLLGRDSVHDESALGVVDETEVLVGLVQRDDVHVSSRVLDIRSHLTVDLHHTAHHDLLALVSAESVVESVSDEDGQWQALAELVWAGIRAVAEHASRLRQHPVVGRIERFEMLLRSTSSHVDVFVGFFCLTLEFSVSST